VNPQRQRSHETKADEKRTVYEVEVDDVGPSLRNASAKVTRAQRSTAAQESQRTGGDPWATAEAGGFSDKPPF
jgi:single-strand DNA-binding protein